MCGVWNCFDFVGPLMVLVTVLVLVITLKWLS